MAQILDLDCPLISVLIPCKNAEKFLPLAVESVLNQSLRRLEVILVIPEGDLRTLSAANLLSISDSRIKILKTSNELGISESLNLGVGIAKTQFIARMDSDDWSAPNRLESQYNFLLNNPEIGIVGTNVKTFGRIMEEWRMPIQNEYIKAGMLFRSTLLHPTVMFRRTLFTEQNLKYLPTSENIPEDLDLWIQASRVTKLANISNFHLLYRVHASEAGKRQDLLWKNLDLLVSKQFLELGLTFTARELELHMACVHNKSLTNQSELNELKNWFDKIEVANNEILLFDEMALKNTLMRELLVQYKKVYPVPPILNSLKLEKNASILSLRSFGILLIIKYLSPSSISKLRDLNRKLNYRIKPFGPFERNIIFRKVRTYGFRHVLNEFLEQRIQRLRFWFLTNLPDSSIKLVMKCKKCLRNLL